jgi:type II secretory pathway pseudopilin PulG
MRRAREEQGFALISAIILLTVILGLGLGLLQFADAQQKASTREQASEAAFNVAEAALNAQIGQLSREWPGIGTATESLQAACTPSTSTTTNYCPEPAILEKAYPNTGSTSCAGTEAWGSSLNSKWATYVREDLNGSPYFNSAEERVANDFDKGHEVEGVLKPWDKLWVRAVGVVDCHAVAVVSQVSEQLVHASFPEGALSANWFRTGNKGNKVIIKHGGKARNGKFSIRCEHFEPKAIEEQKCEQYQREERHREGQVQPELTREEQEPSVSTPSTTLSPEQLEALKLQAKSEGHFYTSADCPTSLAALSGRPAYIEGCKLAFTGGTANSLAEPGFLVLASSTLELGGKSIYYGVVYAAHPESSRATAVVRVKGTAKIVGEIIVDGEGGIELGDKGNEVVAFEYDPSAAEQFETITGAASTRNSFRILPAGQ